MLGSVGHVVSTIEGHAHIKDSVKKVCVPWRLPEHVELARVIEAESLEDHRSNHQLGRACLTQILGNKT